MAVAEICLVGKPVIFVPYPHAAEDHQTANAMALVNKNAAKMVKDVNAQIELMPALSDLIKNEIVQTEMKNNIAQLAVKNADEIVANEIIKKISFTSPSLLERVGVR